MNKNINEINNIKINVKFKWKIPNKNVSICADYLIKHKNNNSRRKRFFY